MLEKNEGENCRLSGKLRRFNLRPPLGGSGGAKTPQLECGGLGGASPPMRGKSIKQWTFKTKFMVMLCLRDLLLKALVVLF